MVITKFKELNTLGAPLLRRQHEYAEILGGTAKTPFELWALIRTVKA